MWSINSWSSNKPFLYTDRSKSLVTVSSHTDTMHSLKLTMAPCVQLVELGIFWQDADHRLTSSSVIGHGYKPFLPPAEPAGQLRGLFSGSALGQLQLFTMVFASYQATVSSGTKQGKLNTSLATGLWARCPCRPSRELTVDDTFHQTGDTHPLGFFQIPLRMQWDTPSIPNQITILLWSRVPFIL